jgi:hypothetical protein
MDFRKMLKSRDVRKCGEETKSDYFIFSRENCIKRRLFRFNIDQYILIPYKFQTGEESSG